MRVCHEYLHNNSQEVLLAYWGVGVEFSQKVADNRRPQCFAKPKFTFAKFRTEVKDVLTIQRDKLRAQQQQKKKEQKVKRAMALAILEDIGMCPISMEPMRRPVLPSSGQAYDEINIVR